MGRWTDLNAGSSHSPSLLPELPPSPASHRCLPCRFGQLGEVGGPGSKGTAFRDGRYIIAVGLRLLMLPLPVLPQFAVQYLLVTPKENERLEKSIGMVCTGRALVYLHSLLYLIPHHSLLRSLTSRPPPCSARRCPSASRLWSLCASCSRWRDAAPCWCVSGATWATTAVEPQLCRQRLRCQGPRTLLENAARCAALVS
jgi:hypothetical protein